jgi:hypothetical protein
VVKYYLAVLLSLATAVAAQTTAKPATKPAPRPPALKSYCHPSEDFCFKYPAGWTMLGEVFNGNGVAVAPPQTQQRDFWDAVTVALVIPAPEGDEDPVTIDAAIAKAVSGVRESGQDFETLQRQQRRVNGKPAQLVKVHYAEKTSGREWIEELVFIEGPDSAIYSVALKCSPLSLARTEPLFLRIVDSFTLPEAAPPPDARDEESPPGQSKAPTKSVPPKNTTPKP